MIHPQDKKYSPNERQAFKQPPTLKECINPEHRLCSSLCLACCLLVSKVSNYTIVVSYIKSNPVHLKFAYFRPVHVNTENKHSLEQAWGKLEAFRDNHCNINCVSNKYACYHGNQLKRTEGKEYQAVSNSMKMLETSSVSRDEDKDLLQILSELSENKACKEHLVLETGTDKYAPQDRICVENKP